MKKWNSLLVLLFMAVNLHGQKGFKPYSSHGVEIGLAFSAIAVNPTGLLKSNSGGIDSYEVYPEIKWNYDYAPLRYLGLGTGLGLTVRGGRNRNLTLYYLNLPMKVQLKAGSFWFEPALQANLLLGANNQTSDPFFSKEDLRRVTLTYTLLTRVNLFKGLSLHGGIESWLTPAPLAHFSHQANREIRYYQFSFIIGARYMFNQPSQTKR